MSRGKIALKRRLRAMEQAGQLFFNKFKQYVIPEKRSVITGKVIVTEMAMVSLRLKMVGKITLFRRTKCNALSTVILPREFYLSAAIRKAEKRFVF